MLGLYIMGANINGGLAGTVEQFPGGQSTTAMNVAALYVRGCLDKAMVGKSIFLTPVLITKENLNLAERIGEVKGLEMPEATPEATKAAS